MVCSFNSGNHTFLVFWSEFWTNREFAKNRKPMTWILFIKSGQESGQLLAAYLAWYAGEEEKHFGLSLWPKSGQGNPASFRPDWQGFEIPFGFGHCPLSGLESGRIAAGQWRGRYYSSTTNFRFFVFGDRLSVRMLYYHSGSYFLCVYDLISFDSSFYRNFSCKLDRSCTFCLRSPGESWAGDPSNPLVRLREKWGRHICSQLELGIRRWRRGPGSYNYQ